MHAHGLCGSGCSPAPKETIFPITPYLAEQELKDDNIDFVTLIRGVIEGLSQKADGQYNELSDQKGRI